MVAIASISLSSNSIINRSLMFLHILFCYLKKNLSESNWTGQLIGSLCPIHLCKNFLFSFCWTICELCGGALSCWCIMLFNGTFFNNFGKSWIKKLLYMALL